MANVGGFRSGLEWNNDKKLKIAGVTYWYESGPCVIQYTLPIRGGHCADCDGKSVVSHHKYTCDFVFESMSGKVIYVECKGHPRAWTSKTRSKHQAIKKQYPEMDLRFVFSNKHAPIGGKSVTTNAEWCKRQGFQCESNLIPDEWLKE